VHPIERLRYVARSSGVPARSLVSETAMALQSFRHDQQALVTACRRVVSRQPTSGALVWFAARVLTAADPSAEIYQASGEVEADPTAAELAHLLPDDACAVVLGWPDEIGEALPRRGDVRVLVVDVASEAYGLVSRLERCDVQASEVAAQGLGASVLDADVVLLEASAVGPDACLAVAGSRAAAATARHAGVPVWLVAGVGRLLPGAMWDPFLAGALPPVAPWEADDEVVPLDLIDVVVGPWGKLSVADALRRTDCPVAPELFRGNVF